MEKPVTEQPPPYSPAAPQTGPPGIVLSSVGHTYPQGATYPPGPNPPGPQPGMNAPPVYTAYPPGTTPYPPGPTPYPPGTTFVPNYGATNIIIPPPIIAVGACPACRVGILEDDFSCLGILCAILFFPIGILCCLILKNRRCTNCGANFA